MSPIAVWKEKFQVSTSCTLTEALKNQLISEIEYQEWASKYYGIPVMKDEFFEKHPLDTKFLDTVQNIANPSAIPCFEWNNILYAACLEPQEINTDQKTVFFITSIKSMESLWKNFEPSTKKTTKQEQTLSFSEDSKTPIQKDEKPQKSEEKTLDIKQKPTVQKMENDGIEFDSMNPLRAFMLSIGDLAQAFMGLFIAPNQKNSKRPIKQKTKSITIPNTNKNNLKEVTTDQNNVKETEKASLQTIIPESIISEIEESDQPQNTSPATQKSAGEKEPSSISLDKEKKPNDTNNSSTKKEKTSIDSKAEEAPMPIALDTEKPVDAEKQSVDPKEKEEMPMPIALDTDEKPVDTDKQSADPKIEETPTPIVLDTDEKPVDTDKQSADPKIEEAPTPIVLDTEKKSANADDPSTQADEQSPHTAEDSPSMDEENSQEHESTASSFLILDQKKATSMDQLSPIRRPLEETKHYINAYILFIFKKDSFIPYKWSSNLQEAERKVAGIIQKPSIFRIVHSSKQPYFGHIAPVLANNSFFNQWGFETLPKHVVLIPFLDAEKQNIIGVYLGISETRTLPIKCLHAIEQIVQPLSTYYEDGSLLQKVS